MDDFHQASMSLCTIDRWVMQIPVYPVAAGRIITVVNAHSELIVSTLFYILLLVK